MGGDFNCHVGDSNKKLDFPGNTSFNLVRTTLGMHCTKGSRTLTRICKNNDFILLNGRSVSDSPAGVTYVSHEHK